MPQEEAPAGDLGGARNVLGDTTKMFAFLEQALSQLEEVQGCADVEAREKLRQLKDHAGTSSQATDMGEFSDLEIASQLDALDAQLTAFESSINQMDDTTKELLMLGTSAWLAEGSTQQGGEEEEQ